MFALLEAKAYVTILKSNLTKSSGITRLTASHSSRCRGARNCHMHKETLYGSAHHYPSAVCNNEQPESQENG